ncbi:hypothetical protein BD13_127 [Salmonella phage BD13]|uniref:Uncharacterized protein n=1 Tax=Salmonella phage BD13 TaxID=2912287 RepID=A0AAE9KZ52_9CAUD|nr:hypothetical protein BD13_127 [Salmonella phage BD13]
MNINKVLETISEMSGRAGKRFTELCIKNQKVPEHQCHYCRDCEQYHEMCMVEDWVWDQIRKEQPKDIILCFTCMERRLGRKITLKDLKHVPCNAPYFIGFRMERF